MVVQVQISDRVARCRRRQPVVRRRYLGRRCGWIFPLFHCFAGLWTSRDGRAWRRTSDYWYVQPDWCPPCRDRPRKGLDKVSKALPPRFLRNDIISKPGLFDFRPHSIPLGGRKVGRGTARRTSRIPNSSSIVDDVTSIFLSILQSSATIITPSRQYPKFPSQHNILYLPSAARQTQRNSDEREERGIYRRSPSVWTIESLMSQAFSSGCANGTTDTMGATSTEGIGGLGRAAEDTVRTNENRMSQIFDCGCAKCDNRNFRNGKKLQSICF